MSKKFKPQYFRNYSLLRFVLKNIHVCIYLFKALDVISEGEDNISCISSDAVDGVPMSFGVPITDDKTILKPMTLFVERIEQLKDIVETMKQFYNLTLTSKTLPLLHIMISTGNNSDSESENTASEIASPDIYGIEI